MPSLLRRLVLFAVLLLALAPASPAVADEISLTGADVARISQTFLRNHFSREPFDNAHSAKMLEGYLQSFDPGHYYFLQGDIDGFHRHRKELDELIPERNIELAFGIFKRFKLRAEEREPTIMRLLEGPFDLKRDDSTTLDRKKAPYPKDVHEAELLWAKRLKFELLEQVVAGTAEPQAREVLRKRYRSVHKRIAQYTNNEVVTFFLNAFTASYDPHSGYLSPDELENFNIALRLSLEGIGATLRWEDGITVISSIIPGGAAAREGTLKPEDKIVGVAQGNEPFEDVRNFRLIDVVKLIRGERGTTVRLAFMRKANGVAEVRKEVAIVRDKIVLKEGEAKGDVLERRRAEKAVPYQIGVIALPSFYVDFSDRQAHPETYKSSSREVALILEKFERRPVDGVVLDLRNNGGGGLDEAVSLAGLFLRRGPIVMVKNTSGRITILSNPHNAPLYRGPLLVMTNRFSASASEIVAGVMKDYGRAILVGDRATFGKGTVQNIINLPAGLGALKTTVAKFYRPGSSSTQHKGVEPDIVLPSLNNHFDIGESSLENALPWDAIRKASYQPWSDLAPFVPVLAERSKRRREGSAEFKRIDESIRTYEAQKEKKVLTVKALLESKGKADAKAGEAGESNDPYAPKKGAPKDDAYLAESIEILIDYIQLQNRETPQSLASLREEPPAGASSAATARP